MKHFPLKLIMIGIFVCLLSKSLIFADDKIVQLALFNPVQIFPEENSITGVRLNLLYGNNASVTGLDFGLVNRTSEKQSVGIQWGILGLADRGFIGLQANSVNVTHYEFKGVQFGFVNVAENANGLMIGIVNFAKRMYGIQIGIFNLIGEGGVAPVLPIVNWAF